VPLNCFVFLDLDDTLVEWSPPWQEVYRLVAAEAGVSVTAERVGLALAEVGRRGDCVQRHAGSDNLRAFRLDHDGQVLARLGVTEDLQAHAERVADLLLLPEACHLYPEVRAALAALLARGARLGLITGRPLARPDLTRFGLIHCFSPVFDALGVRRSKESGHMFHLAAQVANASGRLAWHIGDSYTTDILGARAAGLRPILLDRGGSGHAADCPVARDLWQAIEIVGRG
jgi:putative hydrolase of the HAD superfamily